MTTSSILKASTTTQTYNISLDVMKRMIAVDLDVPVEEIHVEYVLGHIGYGDPLDRYPAPRGVVSIKVTHTKKANPKG